MGQKLGADSIGALTKVSTTSIQLAASRVTVGGQQYVNTSAITANLAATGFNGLDTGALAASTLYYVYAVLSGSSLGIVASLSGTSPSGFTVYTLVGRFSTNGSSQVDTVNQQTVADNGTVGQTMSATLTEAQFQAVHGPGWVLMDGRNVSGSKYATLSGNTTIPDARGLVLRGKNNGRSDGNQDPAGEVALGTFQGDQMQGHYHANAASGTGEFIYNRGGSGVYAALGAGAPFDRTTVPITNPSTDGANGTPRTGLETRTKSAIVNHFMKIN